VDVMGSLNSLMDNVCSGAKIQDKLTLSFLVAPQISPILNELNTDDT